MQAPEDHRKIQAGLQGMITSVWDEQIKDCVNELTGHFCQVQLFFLPKQMWESPGCLLRPFTKEL